LTFGQPWAFALAALALPILLLYLLRGNLRRRPTTAAFLWRGLDQQLTARRSWRRPPRSLALLLQLLALAAGVLALARPSTGEVATRQLVYVLDASASMQATDVSPTRFEAARAAIRQQIQALRPGDQATLIRLAAQPEVLASGTDTRELLRGLERAQPAAAAVDLRGALVMAGQRVEQPINQGSEIVVYSDGTLPDPLGLGSLPLPVRFERIGQSGENQGVSALHIRRAPGEVVRFSGFARLTNYAETASRVPVRITADGVPVDTRQVELPARGRSELPFEVPPGAKTVSVVLGGQDQLALDNRAEVTVPENRRLSTLLVSRSPGPWQQALGVLPGLDVTVQSPSNYQDTGAEIVVSDGFVPPRLPGGQLLVVNPPPGNWLVELLGDVREVQVSSFDVSHPILRSVDLGALRLVRASRLAVPRWATSVAETPGGPLVLHGELEGRRIVVLGFDPLVSGMEKLVSFPILVANVVGHLQEAGTDPFVAPGQRLTLPISPDARELVLERPNGSRQPLVARGGAVQIESADQVGRYTLNQRLASGELSSRTFFVNLFGESESDTTPRDRPAWPPSAPIEAAEQRPGPPIWPPFVAACLALLSVEWLHFLRRG
jgi:hypothetical protein